MKTLLLPLVGAGALWLLPTGQAIAIDQGEALPPVAINHIENGSLENGDLKGKVTVVNFWATWCAACKVEIKEMETAFQQLVDQDNFQLAFVSLDKDPAKAKEWFQANVKLDSFKERLFKDPNFKAAELLDVDSFPMTLVIDQNGNVVHIQRGFKEGEGTTEEIASKASGLLVSH